MGHKAGKYARKPAKKNWKPWLAAAAAAVLLAGGGFLLKNAGKSVSEPVSGQETKVTPNRQQIPITDSQEEAPAVSYYGSDASVVDTYINEDMHLIKVLSDGTELDAGPIGDSAGNDTGESRTVTFKDYNGAVLKTATVTHGADAEPPADPRREGYTFVGWNGSFRNVTQDCTLVAQYRQAGSEGDTCTVTFLGLDGVILKVQVVETGKAASAPQIPVVSGYTFLGWDKTFDSVSADLTVTAQYRKQSSPTISVSSAEAAAGSTEVPITVSVSGNPGILGMILQLSYDDSVMTVKSAENGAATAVLDMTPPGKFADGCKFMWDGLEVGDGDIQDGEILVLTVDIPETAAPGTYPIRISFSQGDIFDRDWKDVSVLLEAGSLRIS